MKNVMCFVICFWIFSSCAQDKKPNIISIMADDLGWQDVGFMGSQWFETPHLDLLISESLIFSNAYMYPTKKLGERSLYWHAASSYKNSPCSIIRKGEWKLIQFLNDGELELYNLSNDLKEANNIISEQEEVSGQLLEELTQW